MSVILTKKNRISGAGFKQGFIEVRHCPEQGITTELYMMGDMYHIRTVKIDEGGFLRFVSVVTGPHLKDAQKVFNSKPGKVVTQKLDTLPEKVNVE